MVVYSLGCTLIRVRWVAHFWLLNETHFVSLDALTMSANNPINIFLINPNVIIYHVLFIKYLWISTILLVSIRLKLTETNFTAPFNPISSYF